MVSMSFKILSETGIHAQSAVNLVNEAIKYSSDVELEVEGKKINMKSIMGVMSLGIYNGEIFTITAEGEDEEGAIDALTDSIYEMHIGKEI